MKDGLAKALGATLSNKDRDKLTAQVARYLLAPHTSTRSVSHIHPSELASEHWCARKAYYGMSGAATVEVQRSMVMEVVFETGHQAHDKWQSWLWEMGLLKGWFGCRYCKHRWEGQSPAECPSCQGTRSLLIYLEVPVSSDEYLIKGQSDGDVDGFGLIEIKTIGEGTVRFDAPHLLERYSYNHVDEAGKVHTGIDMAALWQGIRVPFPSHIKQGMIYCFCMGRDRITFIYEPKFITAAPKEFTIKLRMDMVEDMLDECLIVKQALAKERPPKRPLWAERTCNTCKDCVFKGVCWGGRNGTSDGRDSQAAAGSEGQATAPGPLSPKKARVRFTPTPEGYNRAG